MNEVELQDYFPRDGWERAIAVLGPERDSPFCDYGKLVAVMGDPAMEALLLSPEMRWILCVVKGATDLDMSLAIAQSVMQCAISLAAKAYEIGNRPRLEFVLPKEG